jgi:hypothetical protein
MLRIYGSKSDPSGDAKFDVAGERLWVTVPARPQPTDHELNLAAMEARYAPPGPFASARIWRDVKGDFTAVVRVVFPIRLDSKAKHATPARAAGLVAWAADGNHIGLARVEEWTVPFRRTEEARTREAVQLTYTHSRSVRTAHRTPEEPADALFLRLSRRGDAIVSAYSRDGKKWHDLSTDEVEWPDTVKVGVYVKNFSDAKLEVLFDEYALDLPKK